MIVVDASAAVSALLNDGAARTALATEQVHVPHLIDTEIVSAIRRRVGLGQLTDPAGRQVLDVWSRLAVIRYPVVALWDRVWQLRENLSSYDATYVALAEELTCDLVTADGRLSRAPGLRCPLRVVPR